VPVSRCRLEVSFRTELMKTTLLAHTQQAKAKAQLNSCDPPRFPNIPDCCRAPGATQWKASRQPGSQGQNKQKMDGRALEPFMLEVESKTGSAERLSLSSNDVERPLAEPMMLYEVRDFSGFLLLFFFFFVLFFGEFGMQLEVVGMVLVMVMGE